MTPGGACSTAERALQPRELSIRECSPTERALQPRELSRFSQRDSPGRTSLRFAPQVRCRCQTRQDGTQGRAPTALTRRVRAPIAFAQAAGDLETRIGPRREICPARARHNPVHGSTRPRPVCTSCSESWIRETQRTPPAFAGGRVVPPAKSCKPSKSPVATWPRSRERAIRASRCSFSAARHDPDSQLRDTYGGVDTASP